MTKQSDVLNEVAITRPTSAYDILQRVIDAVQVDVRRLRMGAWYVPNMKRIFVAKPEFVPRCGTSACLAGWIGLVADIELRTVFGSLSGLRPVDFNGTWHNIANLIFGMDASDANAQLRHAFSGGAHFHAEDGTPKQVDLLIKFLRDLMKKHKKYLKARIVLPGGSIQDRLRGGAEEGERNE